MRAILLILASVVCLGLSGCASPFMKPVDPSALDTAISHDEAGIVFFRATTFGAAIQAPVLEVDENGKLRFVAIVSSGSKFLQRTTPGKHLYLIDGEFGYFLEAELDAGKTYYAYVTPRMGWWRARFLFTPATDADLASETFKKDIAWCSWHENTPEGRQWFDAEQSRLESRYSDLIRRYSDFPPESKVKMLPGYGTVVPAR